MDLKNRLVPRLMAATFAISAVVLTSTTALASPSPGDGSINPPLATFQSYSDPHLDFSGKPYVSLFVHLYLDQRSGAYDADSSASTGYIDPVLVIFQCTVFNTQCGATAAISTPVHPVNAGGGRTVYELWTDDGRTKTASHGWAYKACISTRFWDGWSVIFGCTNLVGYP
jgi:hypothetical protein